MPGNAGYPPGPRRAEAGGGHFFAMPSSRIHITDIEAAINHWRQRLPSPDGFTLAPATRALAKVYALMVYRHADEIDEADFPEEALAAWQGWYETTPDTPCIAICSTSQGDDQCKGCGRSFEEVQHWLAYTPAEKRSVWRRITLEHSAWRFNRYAERAAEGPSAGPLQVPVAQA
ncbi:putative Fe-S protein [Acidovorax sp. CF316]|nr:putative Fe-S protein [Acidovorax sp. CF316]